MDQSNLKRLAKIIESASAFILACVLILALRSSVVELYKIPSGSMVPTLIRGDHIFVNKLAYEAKVPFSVRLGHPRVLGQKTPPKRGEVVVFTSPKDASTHFVKRIIGIPGDTLEIKNKTLYLNSKAIVRKKLVSQDAEAVFSKLNDGSFSQNYSDLYFETIDDNQHLILIDRNNFVADNMDKTIVPADHYFVMGDNRDFSNDSRFWGFVPFQNIRGRAQAIWFSFWKDPFAFRPDRIGTFVQ